MPRVDPRITVWRRAIHLFRKTNQGGWEGPFWKAGYRSYRAEPLLLDAQGQEREPDIVATSDAWWACVEVTLSDGSKDPQLDRYTTIESSTLANSGLEPAPNGPVLAVVRPISVGNETYTTIVVGDQLSVEGIEQIDDEALREALDAAEGADLRRIPEIAISLVPESRATEEVRRGLVDIIMAILEPGHPGYTPLEIVDEALERLADNVRQGKKRVLVQRVQEELKPLVREDQGRLRKYLGFDGDRYTSKLSEEPHPNTLTKVEGILREWAGEAPTLFDFEGDDADES